MKFRPDSQSSPLLYTAILLCGSLAWAQTTAKDNQSATTIRATTRLVLVPAIVEDKSGKFVPGLKLEDFILQDGGKERQISVFHSFDASSPDKMSAGSEQSEGVAGVFTNVQTKPPAQNFTIMVLDAVNSDLVDQGRARQGMIDFLQKNVSEQQPTALVLVGRNGPRLVFDFSTDPKLLVQALKRVRGDQSAKTSVSASDPAVIRPSEQAALLLEGNANVDKLAQAQTELDRFVRATDQYTSFSRSDRNYSIASTLESMQQLARAYSGVPGRKQLIWVTAGFPFAIDEPGAIVDKPLGAIYERTFEMLNEANIAMYPVDLRGLFVQLFADISQCTTCGRTLTGGVGRDPVVDPTMRDRTANSATLQTFADMTGGKAFFNRNDIDKSLIEASSDAASYYTLGFYIGDDVKPGYHKIKVQTKKSDLKVRARSGYFMSKKTLEPETARNIDIGTALNSPLEYTGIPIRFQLGQQAPDSDKKKVPFVLTVAPNSFVIDEQNGNAVDLDLLVVARDEKGQEAARVIQPYTGRIKEGGVEVLRSHGLPYPNNLLLVPGKYSVRVIVRDNFSGKMGSLIVPLAVI